MTIIKRYPLSIMCTCATIATIALFAMVNGTYALMFIVGVTVGVLSAATFRDEFNDHD